MAQDLALTPYVVSILMQETRLKLMGLLTLRSYGLEELASLLGVKTSRVLRHLGKLQQLGLVALRPETDGSRFYYMIHIEPFREFQVSWHKSQLHPAAADASILNEPHFEEWERDILKRFFVGTRLKTIPARRKNLNVIVKWFAYRFEMGVTYSEKEVNEIIQRHYDDYAFFKKDLVGRRLMRREEGRYWRVAPAS